MTLALAGLGVKGHQAISQEIGIEVVLEIGAKVYRLVEQGLLMLSMGSMKAGKEE